MSTEQELQIAFGPFRFDPVTGQLMRGERVVALQPKPLAVLQYLARRPGQLVTKQELLKAVWTETVVTKAVVNLVQASNPEDEVFVVNFNEDSYLDQDFTSKIDLLREALDRR